MLYFLISQAVFFFRSSFFFFNDTATTEIYTLSLHDALPISPFVSRMLLVPSGQVLFASGGPDIEVYTPTGDRKSTRLNSSHGYISYAVFCLKKKKKNKDAGMTEEAHAEAQLGLDLLAKLDPG